MSKFKSSNESIFIASSKLAQGFTVIPNEIMNDMKLMGPDAYFVFGKILQYITNPDHKITIQGLSTQLGVSKTRVSNGLNKLIEIGYISKKFICILCRFQFFTQCTHFFTDIFIVHQFRLLNCLIIRNSGEAVYSQCIFNP